VCREERVEADPANARHGRRKRTRAVRIRTNPLTFYKR
jgi:hypothetical protein